MHMHINNLDNILHVLDVHVLFAILVQNTLCWFFMMNLAYLLQFGLLYFVFIFHDILGAFCLVLICNASCSFFWIIYLRVIYFGMQYLILAFMVNFFPCFVLKYVVFWFS